MGKFSCEYFTKLRVVVVSLMTLTHCLMVAALAASKWDGFYYEIVYNKKILYILDAHQNLWTLYDNNSGDHMVAYFRWEDIKLEWKTIAMILVVTGVSIAFLCFCSLLILTFVNRLAQRRKLVTFSIFALAFLCAAAGAIVIYGVRHYTKHYKDNVSENALKPSSGLPLEIHTLTWAPWLCLSAGGMYIVCGLLLLIDAIVFVASKTKVTPFSES